MKLALTSSPFFMHSALTSAKVAVPPISIRPMSIAELGDSLRGWALPKRLISRARTTGRVLMMDCRKQITELGLYNGIYKWRADCSDHEYGGCGYNYSQKHCCYTSDEKEQFAKMMNKILLI